MSTVAAVIVTHNSARWIEQTLVSVLEQSEPLRRILIVDDNSSDATPEMCRRILGDRGNVVTATTVAADVTTRIAANFRQGVVACSDVDIVVLGDHDDIWHANRVAHQRQSLDDNPAAQMIASNGRLIDEVGQPLGQTLRDVFPVPPEWSTATPGDRMGMALRWSIATGGASAIRTPGFVGGDIPAKWLHDRWWSLLATARESMMIDDEIVIDYRVTDSQEVGLQRGSQDRSTLQRITTGMRLAPQLRRRLRDIREGLIPEATTNTRPELNGTRLLRNLT